MLLIGFRASWIPMVYLREPRKSQKEGQARGDPPLALYLSLVFLDLPWVKEAQGPGIGAKGADAGRGVGGQSPPPSKSYYGHPKSPGAQGPKRAS